MARQAHKPWASADSEKAWNWCVDLIHPIWCSHVHWVRAHHLWHVRVALWLQLMPWIHCIDEDAMLLSGLWSVPTHCLCLRVCQTRVLGHARIPVQVSSMARQWTGTSVHACRPLRQTATRWRSRASAFVAWKIGSSWTCSSVKRVRWHHLTTQASQSVCDSQVLQRCHSCRYQCVRLTSLAEVSQLPLSMCATHKPCRGVTTAAIDDSTGTARGQEQARDRTRPCLLACTRLCVRLPMCKGAQGSAKECARVCARVWRVCLCARAVDPKAAYQSWRICLCKQYASQFLSGQGSGSSSYHAGQAACTLECGSSLVKGNFRLCLSRPQNVNA